MTGKRNMLEQIMSFKSFSRKRKLVITDRKNFMSVLGEIETDPEIVHGVWGLENDKTAFWDADADILHMEAATSINSENKYVRIIINMNNKQVMFGIQSPTHRNPDGFFKMIKKFFGRFTIKIINKEFVRES